MKLPIPLFILITLLHLTLGHINSLTDALDNPIHDAIPIPDGYTEIDTTEVTKDPGLHSLLASSVQYVLAQAAQTTLVPNEVLFMTKIFSAYRKTVDNGTNYIFNIELQDQNGSPVNISAGAYYEKSSNSRQMLSFSHSFQHLNSQGTLMYVYVDWTDEQGTYNFTIFPETYLIYNISLDSTYNFTEADLLMLGNYYSVNISEVKENSLAQRLLTIGRHYVVRKYIEGGYLPEDSYDLEQIYSVYRRKPDEQDVLFRFDIEISNGKGVNARVNYETFYQGSTQSSNVPTFGFYKIVNAA